MENLSLTLPAKTAATVTRILPVVPTTPESFPYFSLCSTFSSVLSLVRSPNWLSPSLCCDPDRHSHQNNGQDSRHVQFQSGYTSQTAMAWPEDRKRYVHVPTQAASGFLATASTQRMKDEVAMSRE